MKRYSFGFGIAYTVSGLAIMELDNGITLQENRCKKPYVPLGGSVRKGILMVVSLFMRWW